ncbi:MAG: thioesterase family protein [Pseudomonadota bacterium]
MTPFCLPLKVLFQHCDPAGIVFYPRYFEMINQTVEEWFEQDVGYSFADMQARDNSGVPTVTLQTDFQAPSRLGERLVFELRVTKLGRTSLALTITSTGDETQRLKAELVLVYINKGTGRPMRWPDDVRAKIEGILA